MQRAGSRAAWHKRGHMSAIENLIKKDLKTINYKVVKEDRINAKNKDYFYLSGVQVFCGRQGMGKTISMVKTVLDIKKRFPKCIVVTNLVLNVDFDYISFQSMEELADVLTGINNGIYGVVYAIDEIHTYFNALDSKNIPSYVFTEISQQRKQRKLILGTSQLYLRLAKPFREQSDTLIQCRCIAHKFNIMYVYDGATLDEDFGKLKGTLLKVGWFMQTPELRNSYDTFQKVVSGREEYAATPQYMLDPKTSKKRK